MKATRLWAVLMIIPLFPLSSCTALEDFAFLRESEPVDIEIDYDPHYNYVGIPGRLLRARRASCLSYWQGYDETNEGLELDCHTYSRDDPFQARLCEIEDESSYLGLYFPKERKEAYIDASFEEYPHFKGLNSFGPIDHFEYLDGKICFAARLLEGLSEWRMKEVDALSDLQGEIGSYELGLVYEKEDIEVLGDYRTGEKEDDSTSLLARVAVIVEGGVPVESTEIQRGEDGRLFPDIYEGERMFTNRSGFHLLPASYFGSKYFPALTGVSAFPTGVAGLPYFLKLSGSSDDLVLEMRRYCHVGEDRFYLLESPYEGEDRSFEDPYGPLRGVFQEAYLGPHESNPDFAVYDFFEVFPNARSLFV